MTGGKIPRRSRQKYSKYTLMNMGSAGGPVAQRISSLMGTLHQNWSCCKGRLILNSLSSTYYHNRNPAGNPRRRRYCLLKIMLSTNASFEENWRAKASTLQPQIMAARQLMP